MDHQKVSDGSKQNRRERWKTCEHKRKKETRLSIKGYQSRKFILRRRNVCK